jgi:4-hydroxyphenylpyruvate dioxygenase-like putative hemolysin
MSGHDDWILPIPPNYYDDLASRYGLSEEELVSLRKLNLLYERDDDGSFRHAYMTVSKIGSFSRLSSGAAIAVSAP